MLPFADVSASFVGHNDSHISATGPESLLVLLLVNLIVFAFPMFSCIVAKRLLRSLRNVLLLATINLFLHVYLRYVYFLKKCFSLVFYTYVKVRFISKRIT